MVSAAPEITLLTVEETAELLRLSTASVYRRVEEGELRAVRLGAGLRAPIRISSEELHRYLRYRGEGADALIERYRREREE